MRRETEEEKRRAAEEAEKSGKPACGYRSMAVAAKMAKEMAKPKRMTAKEKIALELSLAEPHAAASPHYLLHLAFTRLSLNPLELSHTSVIFFLTGNLSCLSLKPLE